MVQEPRTSPKAPGPGVGDARNVWPIAADDVVVAVRNRAYTGWLELSIQRTIEAAAGSWRLQGSERSPWPISPGAEVKIYADRDLLSLGYADELRASLGTDDHTFMVGGRDKTADLVDCSATLEPGALLDVTLADVARKVCEPFGIEVHDTANPLTPGGQLLRAPWLERFPTFAINPGETAWATIERGARLRGRLAFCTGDGRLTLSNPGVGRADVELRLDGGPSSNVLSAGFDYKHKDRFQVVTVRGQRPGTDDEFGAAVAQIEGSALDGEIGRYRPLLVLAEGILSADAARTRAQWETTFRAARSAELTVQVQGWRQAPAGRLWTINEVARVRIPKWQIDGDFLITAIKYARGAAGTIASLTLVRPDAYSPKPKIEAAEDPWGELVGAETIGDDDGF